MEICSERQRKKLSRAIWKRLITMARPTVDISEANQRYDISKHGIDVNGSSLVDVKQLRDMVLSDLKISGWTIERNKGSAFNRYDVVSCDRVSTTEASISDVSSWNDEHRFTVMIGMRERQVSNK